MDSVQQIEPQRCAETEQKKPHRRWDTFTDWARTQAGMLFRPLVRAMARLGIHPNTITIFGMLLQLGVAAVFGSGHLVLGGWLLLALAPVDALDGALARALNKQSRFGAFLDSTLDRISDAALVLGLTVHYIRQADSLAVALLLTSLVATQMVSYVRARAEALGFPCKVGVLTRLERIVLIGALSAVGLPMVMMWALAILSVFTMMQRILYVYVVARQQEQASQQ